MPYTKSAARQDYDQVVKELKRQTQYASVKRNSLLHEVQQCVYRNAIFQTSAALEVYLKIVLEHWIHALHINRKTVSDAPKELIYWAAGKKQRAAFENYLYRRDEGKFIDQMASIDDLEIFFERSTQVNKIIAPSAYVSDRKYPSVKNIKALFRRFGVTNIFAEIEKKGKKNYKAILESFSDTRTEIAHHHPAGNLTCIDVKVQLDSISDLVSKVDQVLYSHVIAISGADCWNTNRLFLAV